MSWFKTGSDEDDKYKKIVEAAGAEYVGLMSGDGETLVLFNDPTTHSTISVNSRDCTIESINTRMVAHRRLFNE